MKTLLFLARGFETMEFSPFVDVMGWAKNDYGIDVQVITSGFQSRVLSSFNVPVLVDKTIDEIVADDYDALVIPGGFEEYGFYDEAYDERFLSLIREFDARGKIIAAVCVGALPVAKSGVLENRRATSYQLGDERRLKQLRALHVEVIDEAMVVDRNVITSSGPATAPGVAFKLLELLTDREAMEKVKKAMGF